jgi:hypothetical protein
VTAFLFKSVSLHNNASSDKVITSYTNRIQLSSEKNAMDITYVSVIRLAAAGHILPDTSYNQTYLLRTSQLPGRETIPFIPCCA